MADEAHCPQLWWWHWGLAGRLGRGVMARPASSLRIIVAGLVGLHPVGGVAWDYLQYVLGLALLGHDVYYFEDTWSWPYDPVRRMYTDDPSYSVRFLGDFFERYAPELAGSWRYEHLHDRGYGVADSRWRDTVRSADVFLNISGASVLPDALSASCVKVFVDTDPGYNQIILTERPAWSENVERWCASVAMHDRHFTYAENIYGPDSRVPTASFEWQTTRMPIVLDLWPPQQPPPPNAPWTTIMTWNAFKGPLVHAGRQYLSKDGEFERLMDLPSRTSQPLAVALGGKEAPVDRVSAAGWTVLDGPEATLSAERYQEFIAGSYGELSPAKQVYVALRTGWFSCRTACYLAMGRPAVVQDTGFRHIIPTGAGLFAFDEPQEAIAGLEEVARDWPRHGRAARQIAEAHFSAPRVLGRLLTDAEAGPSRDR